MKKNNKIAQLISRCVFISLMATILFTLGSNNMSEMKDAFTSWNNGDHRAGIVRSFDTGVRAFGFSRSPNDEKILSEMYAEHPEEFSEETIAVVEAAGVNFRGGGSTQQTPTPTPAPTPAPVTKVSEEVTKQPTCTEVGELTIKYSDGSTKTQELPALGHQYELAETVEPTCGIEGYNEYTCTRCGDSYRETIPALEHEWELAETIEPTCDEDGKRIYKCKICGETKEETIPAKEHVPSDWQIVKEAGFFTEGEKQIVCTVCGEVLETERIPAKQDWRIWLGCGAGLIALTSIVLVIIIKKKTT